MKVWKKRTVKWIKDGKKVQRTTEGASKVILDSKRFYGTLVLCSGKRKHQPLSSDKDTSEKLLRKLQMDEDKKKALGITEAESNKKKRTDYFLSEYEKHLRSKGSTNGHVVQQMTRLQALLTLTNTTTLDDLDSGKLNNLLRKWREEGKGKHRKTISLETSNHYVRAIRGFSRWLW